MHGGLSREGLKKFEITIDEQLNGKDPRSLDLEKPLKDLIGKYSYEVEYHNALHKTTPYQNKYGTPTPLEYRAGLSLANFMANGVPVKKNDTTVPYGKHAVTKESMSFFIKSFEALLKGAASGQDTARVLSYDPKLSQLITSLRGLSKNSMFSQLDASESGGNPLTKLQTSLLEGFVGFK